MLLHFGIRASCRELVTLEQSISRDARAVDIARRASHRCRAARLIRSSRAARHWSSAIGPAGGWAERSPSQSRTSNIVTAAGDVGQKIVGAHRVRKDRRRRRACQSEPRLFLLGESNHSVDRSTCRARASRRLYADDDDDVDVRQARERESLVRGVSKFDLRAHCRIDRPSFYDFPVNAARRCS